MVISLEEAVKVVQEEEIAKSLAGFRCSLNLEVQSFLVERAIMFQKAHKSRTYLIMDDDLRDPKVLAYFTLALHLMDVGNVVSKSLRRDLFGPFYSASSRDQAVACFLIGQIGKAGDASERISGDRLMNLALSILDGVQGRIGGRFVKLDCEDIPALIGFYRAHGFRVVQRSEERDMVEMVRFF
jgi:hypothetical protein